MKAKLFLFVIVVIAVTCGCKDTRSKAEKEIDARYDAAINKAYEAESQCVTSDCHWYAQGSVNTLEFMRDREKDMQARAAMDAVLREHK